MQSDLIFNPYLHEFVCSYTNKSYSLESFKGRVGLCECCKKPGKPLLAKYNIKAMGADNISYKQEASGLLKYNNVLPVWGLNEDYFSDVGNTQIYHNHKLSKKLELELYWKCEASNPSGSFKDRGLSVGIALAHLLGAKQVCLPTQGNAGIAASLFSSRLALKNALIYMPLSHKASHYHQAAEAFGAKIFFHGQNIKAAGEKMRLDLQNELKDGTVVELSTFFEPGRLEGKKTLGYEIYDHYKKNGLPDTIFYPTGGGTGLVGIWKAFSELKELGEIGLKTKLPRLIAVQSENCKPIVNAWEQEKKEVEPLVSEGTVADGLDVPAAIMGHGILKALKESNGQAIAVSEKEILKNFRESLNIGLNFSYESSACLAACQKMQIQGKLHKNEKVLLLTTSSFHTSLLKSL